MSATDGPNGSSGAGLEEPSEPAESQSESEFADNRSNAEKRAAIMQALLEAAESGNVPAALKWLELNPKVEGEPEPEALESQPTTVKRRRKTKKAKRAKKPRVEKLTVREERFIEAYFGESAGNGTDAARKAGYKGNDNVLAVTASRLLKKPKIQALVQARLEQVAMPVEHILKGLAEQARGSVEFFLEMEPGQSPAMSLRKAKDAGKLHLIKSISFHDNGTIKHIGWYDSQQAFKTLGNFHRLFRAPNPTKDEAGDVPEDAARNYEIAREDAKRAIELLVTKYNISESDAAKRAVRFFPAAKEWIRVGPEESLAVN